jgi:hypothetical protein
MTRASDRAFEQPGRRVNGIEKSTLVDRIQTSASILELSIDEVHNALSILASGTDGPFDATTRASIGLQLLQRARELTSGTPEHAGQVMWRQLVPRCLRPSGKNPRDRERSGQDYRELLVSWLSDFDEARSIALRSGIISQLISTLSLKRVPEGALWTASVIGLRDPEVLTRLRRVALGKGQSRSVDIATRVLAHLGPNDGDRAWIARNVILRVRRFGWSLDRATTLRVVAVPGVLGMIEDWWTPNSLVKLGDMATFLLYVVADTAVRHPDDHQLQNRAWDMIRRAGDAGVVMRRRIAMSSQIATACNSTRVVPDLLRWAAAELADSHRRSNHPWYVALLRASEGTSRQQVRSWGLQRTRGGAADALESVAIGPSNAVVGEYQTTEGMRHKELAWGLVARAQLPEADAWLEPGIRNESNGFVQRDVLVSAARANCKSLTPAIRQLIRKPFPEATGGNDAVAAQLEAVRFAAGCEEWEAFEAVLTTGVNFGGTASQDSADALFETAKALLGRNDFSRVLETLAHYSIRPWGSSPSQHDRPPGDTSVQRWQWSAAVAALADLAVYVAAANVDDSIRDSLSAVVAGLVVNFASEVPDAYELSLLVAALGFIKTSPQQGEAVDLLPTFARRHGWVRWRAIEALIRLDRLSEYSDIERQLVGTQSRRDVHGVDSPADGGRLSVRTDPASAWLGYCLGLLYHKQPKKCAASVAALLKDGDWEQCAQLAPFLTGKAETPIIQEALLRRIEEGANRGTSELALIAALARIAPNRLAEQLVASAETWHALARSFGARALAGLQDETHVHTINVVLTRLAQDAATSVRLAALDELRHRSSRSISAIARKLSLSVSRDLRVRAAEAAGFASQSVARDILDSLGKDPERNVREAAEKARVARTQRDDADSAVENIAAGLRADRDLKDLVRFGDQLEIIGDLGHLARLRSLPTTTSSIRVRQWLGAIMASMESRLQKEHGDRSSDWVPNATDMSIGSASLLIEGKEFPAEYTMWRSAAANFATRGSWGGALKLIRRVAPDAILDANSIRFADGLVADILVTAVSGNIVLVTGSGPFPAPSTISVPLP